MNRRDFEVVDEGVLTISDRDVRYRANCCHGDSDADGDYQMFTNEHAIGKYWFLPLYLTFYFDFNQRKTLKKGYNHFNNNLLVMSMN